MLSDILGETIIVSIRRMCAYPNGFCQATFRSSKALRLKQELPMLQRMEVLFLAIVIQRLKSDCGKYAIAISDGMGNGERAHYESKETLQLLQKISTIRD